MKVLHIGWGFKPWRGGGLIEYAEDLMNIQADNGWEVSYLFSGRYYPYSPTKLEKWKNGNINMFEIINSPLFHAGDFGTIYPKLDLEEKTIENYFREVLNQVRPDIIHIQELAGLPSSLIEIAKKEYKIPLVMTLHDYFLLCPTLKLFKYNNQVCIGHDIKDECVICCRNAPKDGKFLIITTLLYYLKKIRLFKPILKIKNILSNFFTKNPGKIENGTDLEQFKPENEDLKLDYQRRRDTNIARLKKIDKLISVSHRMEDIYRSYGINNLITLHSTVKHLELIKPKIIDINNPIKFGTLSSCGVISKGSQVLLEAVDMLILEGYGKHFELHIWGGMERSVKRILNYEDVFYHGPYETEDLNGILGTVDVGIVPSIWEEAYGFTGIEFLAKGVPVIGNKRGGIVDYVTDGETGWLNKTASGKELAAIMERIIKNPEDIMELNRKIIEIKGLFKSMNTHFNEIQDLYLSLIKEEFEEKIK
jgi:glycosyltransferase involved in cell wall biosynthesis